MFIVSSMSYDRAQKLYLHLSPSAETEDDAAQAVKVTSNHITTTGLSSTGARVDTLFGLARERAWTGLQFLVCHAQEAQTVIVSGMAQHLVPQVAGCLCSLLLRRQRRQVA